MKEEALDRIYILMDMLSNYLVDDDVPHAGLSPFATHQLKLAMKNLQEAYRLQATIIDYESGL